MLDSGLTIFVGEVLGVPKVSLSGSMEALHEHAIKGILKGFCDQGTSSLVLDLAGLTRIDAECASILLKCLRQLAPTACVHVVAESGARMVLDRAGIGPGVKTYATLDDMAEEIGSSREYLTSRWMATGTEDSEMPMAA